MYIVIAVLVFGIIIMIHELGHFTAAKLLGVKVNEFAIGMGPRIFSRKGKETEYSLRALPFGGFCAMEGEDEQTGDSRAFSAQKRWRRIIILSAGAALNFAAGFLIIVLLTMRADSFAGTTVTQLSEGFPYGGQSGIMVGDTILSINGERLYYAEDFQTFMTLAKNTPVDIVLRRGDVKITLNKFELKMHEYEQESQTRLRYGITLNLLEGTLGEKLKYSMYNSLNFIRLTRVSIAQLISGAAGLRDLSGPVGIVSVMNDIGQSSPTMFAALLNIMNFAAFITINLAVMNMLPIPALDGGRILFIFITWIVEKATRRKINPKYEGYVHMTAFALLMGLMVFTLINDVVKIVNG